MLGGNVNSIRSLFRHARNSLKMRLSSYASALFFIPRQMKWWTGLTGPATAQATGTFTVSFLSSLTLHFALIILIVVPTTMKSSSDYTDSITVSLLQAGEYQVSSIKSARIELHQPSPSETSETVMPYASSFGQPGKKRVGGQNARRNVLSKQSGGLGKEGKLPLFFEARKPIMKRAAINPPSALGRPPAMRDFIPISPRAGNLSYPPA